MTEAAQAQKGEAREESCMRSAGAVCAATYLAPLGWRNSLGRSRGRSV